MLLQEALLVIVLLGIVDLRDCAYTIGVLTLLNVAYAWPHSAGLGDFPAGALTKPGLNGWFVNGVVLPFFALVPVGALVGLHAAGIHDERFYSLALGLHIFGINVAILLVALGPILKYSSCVRCFWCTACRSTAVGRCMFSVATWINPDIGKVIYERGGFEMYWQAGAEFAMSPNAAKLGKLSRIICCLSTRPFLESKSKALLRPPPYFTCPRTWAVDSKEKVGGQVAGGVAHSYHMSLEQVARRYTGEGCPVYSGKRRALDGSGNWEANPWCGAARMPMGIQIANRACTASFNPGPLVDELHLRWQPRELVKVSITHGATVAKCVTALAAGALAPGDMVRIGENAVFTVKALRGNEVALGQWDNPDKLHALHGRHADAADAAWPEPTAQSVQMWKLERTPFVPAPCGTNAIASWFGMIATHEFFSTPTGEGNYWENRMDSFLDLQTLYGTSSEACAKVRSFEGGKLKPDVIADTRFYRTHAPRALLVLFNREHNLICDQLVRRYPTQFVTANAEADDNAIFDAARQINIQVFIGCIQAHYVGNVVGKESYADPRFEAAPHPKQDAPMHCSVEFNLLYRFHQTVPEYWSPVWQYEELGDGFDLEEELRLMVSNPCGAFTQHNVPTYLRDAEIGAYTFSRANGVCSFNDLREHFGMPRYTSFSEFSTDPEVGAILQRYYATVNDVELYPGVLAEDGRPMGWGVPPTMLVCIVTDALSSIIFDRFHCREYTREALTQWGYEHAADRNVAMMLADHTGIQNFADYPYRNLLTLPGFAGYPYSTVSDSRVQPHSMV